MNVVQTQASIVFVARNQDPSIITKDWLINNEILAEEPLDFVNTSVFSHVRTQDWILVVDQQKVMARLTNISPNSLCNLQLMMKKYIEKLPTFQYRAIGINSKWQVRDTILAEILKPIFSGNSDLFANVVGEKHLVGGILLWDYETFKVRMTAEPQSPKACLDFNFHADVAHEEDLHARLSNFSQIMSYTDGIASALLGGAE